MTKKIQTNVENISKHTKKGETVRINGKVLGNGEITHAVTVAAQAFSETAKQKIEKAGGKAILITELKTKARVMK